MNKFIIAFAALAVVGAVSASPLEVVPSANRFVNETVPSENRQFEFEYVPSANRFVNETAEEMTQFAVFPNDDREVAKLPEDKAIFRDFCISARDDVSNYLKQGVNAQAAEIFKLIAETFSNSASKVGEEAGQAATQAEQLIEEDAFQAKSALGNIANAFKNVISEEFKQKLTELQEQFTGEQALDIVSRSCAAVSGTLRPQIESTLAKTKKELLASGADAKTVKEAKLNNLGCATMSRLHLVSSGCGMFNVALPSIRSYFE